MMKMHPVLIKVFFLLVGVGLFSFTNKLPDWRWMSQKSDPYFSMFETGLPIFRPWLPVEAFEWHWLGSNWFSANLTYGLLGGWVLWVLLQNNKPRGILFGAIGIAASAIAIWYTGNGGTLYDITGIFSLVYLLYLLRNIDANISNSELVGIGCLMAMLDLSRPFAISICVILLAYTAIKLRARAVIPLYVLIILVAPFHINQLVRYNTFELSTYGGNNLVEALGGKVLAGEDCFPYEATRQLDSLEAAQCAAANKRFIVKSYVNDPSLLRHTINIERLGKVLFPNLVWHATGLDPKTPVQIAVQKIFNGLLLIIYIMALLALFQKHNRAYKLTLLLIAGYVIGITLMANRLSETLRVILPATMTLVVLSQTYVRSKGWGLYGRS